MTTTHTPDGRAIGPDADLTGAVLRGAVLRGADLTGANLTGANLTGANLTHAVLTHANLTGANLTGANLGGAVFRGATLTDATLPDGRTLAEWRADPLAGLCTDPDAVARATAAWGAHTWRHCPLHEGMGIDSLDDVDDDHTRLLAATFVALFDGRHLPRPGGAK